MKVEILRLLAVTEPGGRIVETGMIDGKMVDVQFPKAFEEAKKKIVSKFPQKGNTWQNMSSDQLAQLLGEEWAEFKREGSTTDELLDVINCVAMLWDCLQKEQKGE